LELLDTCIFNLRIVKIEAAGQGRGRVVLGSIVSDSALMHPFLRRPAECFGKPVCRLGLASRGDSQLTPDDVLDAIDHGVNFLNWPAHSEGLAPPDAFSRAIAELGPRREQVVVCIQLWARDATGAAQEFRAALASLRTDYVDVVTLYYVERAAEWKQVTAAGGALRFCQQAKADGRIRRIGITSHQRPLAAAAADSGLLDVLMIRYNAAHRGAEDEIFPVADRRQIPVVAYTALRWGALVRPTPDDPNGFRVPPAPDWYRFALQADSVAVVLAAPADRGELAEDLKVLRAAGPLDADEYAVLADHGQRVRRHAGRFP
jgi:predicted aldo/keto reductase-like oxidoreductase